VTILGASFDTVDDNRAFKQKFDWPFELLSDIDEQVGVAYEVRDAGTDKVNYAKRHAYLVDPQGVIRKGYDVGKTVAEFAAYVLDDVRAFQG
jgi:peroxiredoxin Q/BCP